MSQKEKLIKKLQSDASFTFDELVVLLGTFSYELKNKGKTNGSRVQFVKTGGVPFMIHRPHPGKELAKYQKKQLLEFLEREGLI